MVINYPSEISFLTVGQNINQTVTEIFITIFFAFLSDLSHIKIAILLGSIVRAEFKLSSPARTPQPPGLHQHFDKLVSRMCPWLKISYLTELLKNWDLSL